MGDRYLNTLICKLVYVFYRRGAEAQTNIKIIFPFVSALSICVFVAEKITAEAQSLTSVKMQ